MSKECIKPESGVYSDPIVYKCFKMLLDAVNSFIEHKTSGSIPGVKERMIVKSKVIENLAKNLRIACEAKKR